MFAYGKYICVSEVRSGDGVKEGGGEGRGGGWAHVHVHTHTHEVWSGR